MAPPSATIGSPQFPLSSSDIPTSAVQAVFDIPELLVNILRYLPFHGIHPNGITDYQPQQLFCVQRVNRHFSQTIRDSQLLCRLMFMRPFVSSAKLVNELYGNYLGHHIDTRPLEWLSCRAGFWVHRYSDSLNADVWKIDVKRTIAYFNGNPKWNLPEASWRQMRVISYANSGSTTMDYTVEWSQEPTGYLPELETVRLEYTERQSFGLDATCGHVYEAALEVSDRSFMEHAHAAAAVLA